MNAGGPAFSAYQSTLQSLTGGSDVKVQLQSEEFDTDNCFDSTTNYRFQPTVAGYYQLDGSVQNAGVVATYFQVSIWKNGAAAKYGTTFPTAAAAYGGATVSGLVYLNGSTDYVELYTTVQSTVNTVVGASRTYFQGFLVRAA